jgi:2-polyprenyl-6-methoxyphenol hydroxylase-like FAD-dependent oxidoreductase
MERWTFHMIAGADGAESQVRITLRAGSDPSTYPRLQVGLNGVEVALDAAPVDYEAPEWKALQLFTAAGSSADRWEELKGKLRAQV